jgi:hypothetical protein
MTKIYHFISEGENLTLGDEYMTFDSKNKKVVYQKIPEKWYGTKVHLEESQKRYFRRPITSKTKWAINYDRA